MLESMDTVVIGAGQAGLSASYYLTRQGREHVVLEKCRVAESWQSGRWDSFTLVTPNWTVRLPGYPYRGDGPDGFMARDEVVAYLQQYAEQIGAPVRLGVEVTAVEQGSSGAEYVVSTTNGALAARNVIVATSLFQQPRIPPNGSDLPDDILQIHSSAYRNPTSLPHSAVLVVGSSQSGAQIAEELYEAGRKVYLCVSRSGRGPRRYRGKDIVWWLGQIGGADRTVDDLPSPSAKFGGSPHISGKGGGRTLNLHQFARDGVVLLGRLKGVQGQIVTLAPDLMENLTKADEFSDGLKKAIDKHILDAGLSAPDAPADDLEPRDGFDAEDKRQLDLRSAGIETVVWATGYTFDFGWVRLPVLDKDGYPIQKRGVTAYPGLYFLGLPWLHTADSGLLSGVGGDAAHVTADIAARA